MTLIDLFREFSSVATRDKYPPSSRVLYYTMLWCWNERRRPEAVTLPNKELYTLAGLPKSSFQDAFAYLSDRGWCKRVRSRHRLEFGYKLAENRPSGGRAAGFVVHAPTETEEQKNQGEKPPTAAFPPDSTEGTEHDTGSIVLGRPAESDDSGGERDSILSGLLAAQGGGY